MFLASANITVNTVLVNKLEGTEFLEYWNTINLLYGITDIGLNINDFIKARNQAKLKLASESSEINTTFDGIANDLEVKIGNPITSSALVNALTPDLKSIHNRLVSAGVPVFEQGGVIKYVTENGNEFAKIENGVFSVSFTKPNIPNPSTYLDASYIVNHLRKFEQEGFASRIVLKDAFDKYGIGKPDIGKTEFVSLKSDIDKLIKDSNGNLDILSKTLGVPKEQLAGGLVRVDFKITPSNKIYMPTGNEFGANVQWLPGGKLPTGQLEAVVKTEGMIKNVDYTVKDIIW